MFTTITYVSIIITAAAIKIDEYTQFSHSSLPFVAFGGVLAVIVSLFV